jgi:hypothetical protein
MSFCDVVDDGAGRLAELSSQPETFVAGEGLGLLVHVDAKPERFLPNHELSK